MSEPELRPPPGAKTSVLQVRVPYYDTDGMGIVYHGNYVHYLEVARIKLLDEHDRPYKWYVDQQLYYAVTRCEVRYNQAARYDDLLDVTCWLSWLRGASLGIRYRVERSGQLVATAITEHAMVDAAGRPVRIPAERRSNLMTLLGT
jgi:acyl-CoA thioester hydrolase